eukprot:4626958-Amphidinium_carterae.1
MRQPKQLAYNMGHSTGPARAAVLQTELDQSHRQFGIQSLSLGDSLRPCPPPPQLPLLSVTWSPRRYTTCRHVAVSSPMSLPRLTFAPCNMKSGCITRSTGCRGTTSAQEALNQSLEIRVTATHAHHTASRRLEQQEASMGEVEVLTARERDQYYEELLTQVQHSTLTASQAVAAITPAPAQPTGTPAASSRSGSGPPPLTTPAPHGASAALQPQMSVPAGSPIGGVYPAPTPPLQLVPTPYCSNNNNNNNNNNGGMGPSGSLSRNPMTSLSAGCSGIDPPTPFTTRIQPPSPISVPTTQGLAFTLSCHCVDSQAIALEIAFAS